MQTTIEKRSLDNRVIQAKECFAEFRQAEKMLLRNRDLMLSFAYRFGGILCELKEELGHGKWMIWLPANFPELGSSDERRIRNAARCIALFKDNEASNSQNSANFSIDSIRKFMWGYIPAKERLQLDGDREIKPGAHHLTFVNQFSKYDRQLKSGHINGFELETFQRELEPMLRRIIEIAGRDWVASLLS